MGSAGIVSGTTSLALQSNAVNGSGLGTTSIGSDVVAITGTGYRLAAANAISAPINLGMIHVGGSFGTQALAVTNTVANDGYSEALNATITPTGDATANGSISLLGPTLTDSSSLTVGLCASAGQKSGTATVTLASDGTGSSGLGTTTLGTQAINVTGSVFSGNGIWTGNLGSLWGSQASGNWTDANGVQAAPGTFPGFTNVDTATFAGSSGGTVSLNNVSPSLAAITFSNSGGASYTLAQGTGGTLTLNAGSGTAAINVAGNQTIAAPVNLATTAGVTTTSASDLLTVSGAISGPGGLTHNGPGTLLLQGVNSYSGATTVTGGLLTAGALNTLSPNSAVTVSGGTLDVSGYAQQIQSLSVGSLGTLNLGIGQLLSVSGSAGLAGTLDIIGSNSITSLPYALMTYSGSPTGTFGNVVGLPSTDKLSYGSGTLDIVAAVNAPNYSLAATLAAHTIISGGSAGVTVTLTNAGGGQSPDNINFTGLSATTGANGTINGLASSGSNLAPSLSATNAGLNFSGNTPGVYTVSALAASVTGANGTLPTLSSSSTDSITVLDHAAPRFRRRLTVSAG